MLNIYKILKNTTSEGPGKRFCIWVQGCHKHCEGCYATQTWSFNCGEKYTIEKLFNIIQKEQKNIEGVTFLGGEPFEQAKELALLAKKVKNIGLSIVCFSGFTYEELKSAKDKNYNSLLANIDLLIDGGFEKDNFDLSRPWVGSKNQKYIFLTDRYIEQKILKYKNKIEIRISKEGILNINGMGNFDNINQHFSLQLGKCIIE